MARDLILITQPYGSNLCGQACLAMIANCSIDSAIEVTGKKGSTTSKDILGALKKWGIPHAAPRKAGRPPIPVHRAIVNISSKQKPIVHHWVVWSNGAWYDPSHGFSEAKYHHDWQRDIFPTFFIEIKTPPPNDSVKLNSHHE